MSNALSSGLAGLRAHQQYIDVVGNNIANVNTPGYRGQRATFSELLALTLRPAMGPGGNIGGTNPMQIGLGVALGAINTDMNQGSLVSTGRSFDLAIEGNGFFATSDGVRRLYSRVGSFGFDANADLVDLRTGYRVLGANGSVVNVPPNLLVPAQSTSEIVMHGNLPAKVTGPVPQTLVSTAPFVDGTTDTPAVAATLLNDLDSNGIDYVNGDTILITGSDADGTPVNVTFTFGVDGTTLGDLVSVANAALTGGAMTIEADGSLKLLASATGVSQLSLAIVDSASNPEQTAWEEHAFDITVLGAGPDTATTSIEVFDSAGIGHNVTIEFERQDDGTWNATASIPLADGTITNPTITGLQFGPNGKFLGITGTSTSFSVLFTGQSAFQSIDLDFGTVGQLDGITQFGEETTVQAFSQDGYATGSLASISFNSDGELIGFFTNGISQSVGQVGLATFANSEGLSRDGDTNFVETTNSGVAFLGPPNTGAAGAVRAGALEGSNVDIAREFVNLIEAQRGFQANARVISSTDEMLSELVNIVR